MAATANGAVTAADFAEFFTAVRGACALSYYSLFDGSAAEFLLTELEVLGVGAGIKDLQAGVQGPLAFVLSDENTHRLARMLGILATARRPLRLFRSRRSAEHWLKGFAAGT